MFVRTLLTISIAIFSFACVNEAPKEEISKEQLEKVDQFVSLQFDFGDKKELKTIAQIPWTAKMTVDDALDRAKELQQNIDYSFEKFGAAGRFYTSFDSMFINKEAKEYWLLCVNDTSSTVGSSSRTLKPNDVVQWNLSNWDNLKCIKMN